MESQKDYSFKHKKPLLPIGTELVLYGSMEMTIIGYNENEAGSLYGKDR